MGEKGKRKVEERWEGMQGEGRKKGRKGTRLEKKRER